MAESKSHDKIVHLKLELGKAIVDGGRKGGFSGTNHGQVVHPQEAAGHSTELRRGSRAGRAMMRYSVVVARNRLWISLLMER